MKIKKTKFKIGDKVVINDARRLAHGSIGNIVDILGYDIHVVSFNGRKYYNYFFESQLKKYNKDYSIII